MFNIIPNIKLLRPIGKDSLFYYLYHILFIGIVTVPLVKHYELPRMLPFILGLHFACPRAAAQDSAVTMAHTPHLQKEAIGSGQGMTRQASHNRPGLTHQMVAESPGL